MNQVTYYETRIDKTSVEKIDGATWLFPFVGIGPAADCLLLHFQQPIGD
jgi:hypothetical protein